MKLRGRKQKQAPPDRPFAHTDDCRIVRADPDAQIEWSYVGDRRWERVCRCGREDWYEPASPCSAQSARSEDCQSPAAV